MSGLSQCWQAARVSWLFPQIHKARREGGNREGRDLLLGELINLIKISWQGSDFLL